MGNVVSGKLYEPRIRLSNVNLKAIKPHPSCLPFQTKNCGNSSDRFLNRLQIHLAVLFPFPCFTRLYNGISLPVTPSHEDTFINGHALQAQTPQQRRANAKFARTEESKRGKPESDIKKPEKQKSPVSMGILSRCLFLVRQHPAISC